MKIETERLIITEFTMDMAQTVHLNALAENKASVKVMERCGFVREFEGFGAYQGAQHPISKFRYRLP